MSSQIPEEEGAGGLFSELSPKSAGPAKRPNRTRAVPKDQLRELVGEVRPGDGVDPREEQRRRRRRDAEGVPLGQAHGLHRQEQFLAQVRDAIDSALLAASAPMLNALTVHALAKQGGSLVAVLVPRSPGAIVDAPAAKTALAAAASWITREVARTVTRKDAPHLRFEVLSCPTDPEKRPVP